MPISVAVINQKGGVGKTTTTFNLAGAFALTGQRVLAIDVDLQGDLSTAFLDDHESLPLSIADLFAAGAGLADVVQPTSWPAIDIVPADERLNAVDRNLDFLQGDVGALRDALAGHAYDVVLFDCAPQRHLSTFAALCAADLILVPVEPSLLSSRAGLTIARDWQSVRGLFNAHCLIRYFLSKGHGSAKGQAFARQAIADTLGAGHMLRAELPRLAALGKSTERRRPVVYSHPRSKAAQLVAAFAGELLAVVRGAKGRAA
jgi:chromosome partitioning protein